MTGGWQAFAREWRIGGWRSVIAAAVGYGLGVTVIPYYTLGVFVRPLEQSYGWSRGQVQASMIVVVFATLIGSSAIGWLADRHGVRKIALISQVGLGIGFVLLGLTPNSLFYWYGAWFVMYVLGLGTSPITWTRSVAGCFDQGRGFALAIALCGTGLSALIVPAATAAMIAYSGWQSAYFMLAAMVWLVGIPTTWLFLPKSETAPGGTDPETPAAGAGGLDAVRAAVRTRQFWLLTGCLVLTGFAISGIVPNLVPMMVERGIPAEAAAGFMGFMGMSIIVGRLITGFLLDRIWAPIVACIILPLPAISCLVLAGGASDYTVVAACVVLLGLATGAEFDLTPYLVTRYFGLRPYSQIYALQWIAFTTVAGFAPATFGYSYDITGNYSLLLYVGAVFFLVSPLLLLALGRYPKVSETEDEAPFVGDPAF